MKSAKTLYIIITALFIVFLGSCQKEEDPGGTAVQAMSGEWWLQWNGKGSYYGFSTYNTAANLPTEMWLDDSHNFWEMKGKVTTDVTNKTFTATKTPNEYYNITFNITKGNIILNGSKGPVSKTVTDSIYFEAEFSDDPGTIYKLSGYRRTRYAGDDH